MRISAVETRPGASQGLTSEPCGKGAHAGGRPGQFVQMRPAAGGRYRLLVLAREAAPRLPEPVADLAVLARLLDGWDPARRILWADEALAGPAQLLAGLPRGPWAILIGPEGGWSESERRRISAMDCVTPVSLGPRILRADTAAVASLALWQAAIGDWC